MGGLSVTSHTIFTTCAEKRLKWQTARATRSLSPSAQYSIK